MKQLSGLDAVFFCPHTPEEDCDCRKPKPGMMLEIGRRYGIALEHVPMVADTLRDLQAAVAAGCQPHLVLSGRSQGLQGDALQELLAQVPGAHVHEDMNTFADFLLQRDHIVDSSTGGLS